MAARQALEAAEGAMWSISWSVRAARSGGAGRREGGSGGGGGAGGGGGGDAAGDGAAAPSIGSPPRAGPGTRTHASPHAAGWVARWQGSSCHRAAWRGMRVWRGCGRAGEKKRGSAFASLRLPFPSHTVALFLSLSLSLARHNVPPPGRHGGRPRRISRGVRLLLLLRVLLVECSAGDDRAVRAQGRPGKKNKDGHRRPAGPTSLQPARPLLLQGRVHTHTRVRAPAPAPAPHTTSPYPSLTHCMAKVVVIADGQVTRGSEVVKPNVRKVRRLGGGAAIGGFAGATADAFTLWERLEQQLEAHPGQLTRAAVELAKAWRSDKFLRRLDATMVVADGRQSLTITGGGDVLEPHDGVLAVGSGAPYALAAARALVTAGPPGMDALAIGAWFYVLFFFLARRPDLPMPLSSLSHAPLFSLSPPLPPRSQARHEHCGGRLHLHQPQLCD